MPFSERRAETAITTQVSFARPRLHPHFGAPLLVIGPPLGDSGMLNVVESCSGMNQKRNASDNGCEALCRKRFPSDSSSAVRRRRFPFSSSRARDCEPSGGKSLSLGLNLLFGSSCDALVSVLCINCQMVFPHRDFHPRKFGGSPPIDRSLRIQKHTIPGGIGGI